MENQKNPQSNLLIGLVALILIAIGMMGYMAYIFTTEGTQCVLEPLVYGAKQLEQENGGRTYCTCSIIDSQGYLAFDGDGSRVVYPSVTP